MDAWLTTCSVERLHDIVDYMIENQQDDKCGFCYYNDSPNCYKQYDDAKDGEEGFSCWNGVYEYFFS